MVVTTRYGYRTSKNHSPQETLTLFTLASRVHWFRLAKSGHQQQLLIDSAVSDVTAFSSWMTARSTVLVRPGSA